MVANIDEGIIMCQNSLQYFLYIDSLNALNNHQTPLLGPL